MVFFSAVFEKKGDTAVRAPHPLYEDDAAVLAPRHDVPLGLIGEELEEFVEELLVVRRERRKVLRARS